MMRLKSIILTGLAAVTASGTTTPGVAMAQHNNQVESVASISEAESERVDAILREFVADYRNDPMALNSRFGVKLGQEWWSVEVRRNETASARGRLTDHSFGPHDIVLSRGAPEQPTWYFEIASLDVLERIASGEVNAGTAAMQSFGSDRVGVETRDMDGFASTSGDEGDMYIALSHFFTKGKPEITRFGRDNSLMTHGAQATALHMMKGFRVMHFSIGPQEVANDDPRMEFGQMPNLFVVTSGQATLYSDDGPVEITEGMSIFIPQFVRHRIVNDGDEPLEGILVLYGDNSDFAFGTSYPTYLEDVNAWHRDYQFHENTQDDE
ncbi:cupin domain-containing protein [Aurantiacibacter sp. MUD11]|uniref:cupin domain-containing protein n=1 Tax=Aurantiacibacter sp. MUD11 TaxID=3003265 RepID=UPI0022AA5E4D|nr:cupin domain-containing protein [Aurantiacibacter sp. MUD11]WAT19273.1 cupin domain-containing protein [Aurantiacibacter sp. MUD11]